MPTYHMDTPDEVVFDLSGYLNRGVLADLSSRLLKADSASPALLTLNCADLYYLDSSVIGLLVEMHQRVSQEGRRVRLRHVPESILRVLQTARLDKILNLEAERRRDRLHFPPGSPPEPVLGSLRRCWELYDCGADSCRNYSRQVYDCWLSANVPCKPVISRDLQTEISGCVRCEVFKNNINQFGQIHVHVETYIRQSEQAYHRLLGERESIEDNLRRTADYAEQLFEKATDAIVVFDETSGEIRSANAPARRILEIEGEEIAGKSLFDYCPALQSTPRPWERSVLTEDSHHRRWDQEWVAPSGARPLMEVTFSRVSLPRQGTILAIARDVSRQREAESMRQRFLANLEERGRALSAYIGWSHRMGEAESMDSLAYRMLDAWLEAFPRADAGLLLFHESRNRRLAVRGSRGYAHPGHLAQLRLEENESLPGLDGAEFWGSGAQGLGGTPVIERIWQDSLGPRVVQAHRLFPIRCGSTVLGFVLLHSFRDERAFEGGESPVTTGLVRLAATSLARVSALEDKLRQVEGLLEQRDSLPGAAIILDETGAMGGWNRTAETWFGWGEEEVIGQPLAFLFGDMGPILWGGIFRGTQETGVWTGNGAALSKAGVRIPVKLVARPIGTSSRLTGRTLLWLTMDSDA